MSRAGYEGPDMTQPQGRAGLSKRLAEQDDAIALRMRFDGLGSDPVPSDRERMKMEERDRKRGEARAKRERYDRSKSDPYDEAWGYDR